MNSRYVGWWLLINTPKRKVKTKRNEKQLLSGKVTPNTTVGTSQQSPRTLTSCQTIYTVWSRAVRTQSATDDALNGNEWIKKSNIFYCYAGSDLFDLIYYNSKEYKHDPKIQKRCDEHPECGVLKMNYTQPFKSIGCKSENNKWKSWAKIGEWGNRTPDLPHAKRSLYPWANSLSIFWWILQFTNCILLCPWSVDWSMCKTARVCPHFHHSSNTSDSELADRHRKTSFFHTFTL